MDSPLANRIRIASSLCMLSALLFCVSLTAQGQDTILLPSLPAPPPMKFISGNERTQLSTARDPKERLKTSLLMAEIRLQRAEQLTADQRFIGATSELGVYQAIIEDALGFMAQQQKDSNKTRDLYKRLEIELRKHCLRLESMRRVTPSEYAVHVKSIVEFADDARTSALNCFFSDTVLEIPSKENNSPTENAENAAADQAKKP
jgi:hypothetical protein